MVVRLNGDEIEIEEFDRRGCWTTTITTTVTGSGSVAAAERDQQ